MIISSLNRQRGVSLLIVLLLLLIMTLLGLAGLRSTIMEEKMSSNQYDRSISFQAAESALREAEAIAATKPTFPGGAACDATGLCARPTGLAIDRWRDTTTTWRNAAASLSDLERALPQYIIEDMGTGPNWPGCDRVYPQEPNCTSPRYRITARSAAIDRAQVILQSNYTPL
jgi:type IV pilus assembly protein PilX